MKRWMGVRYVCNGLWLCKVNVKNTVHIKIYGFKLEWVLIFLKKKVILQWYWPNDLWMKMNSS